MKKIGAFVIASSILVLIGCDLEEEPLTLSSETIFSTGENAKLALDGIYAGYMEFNLMNNMYHYLLTINSGMFVTRRGGDRLTNPDNSTYASLRPESAGGAATSVWGQSYVVIGRANNVIKFAEPISDPITADNLLMNDVIGQAYFTRAFLYFSLVRLFGEVPMDLEPATVDRINLAASSEREIYDQVILDAQRAAELMNGTAGPHYPTALAANMLLAKVYMTLATAPSELQDTGVNYWQAAYDEAIKLYGKFTLVEDYNSLFNEETSDNTTESIFELQSSDEASHDWVRSFTPPNFMRATSFGRLQVSATFYERHVAVYPADPRLESTFISTWVQQNNQQVSNRYPTNTSRSTFSNAHPFLFKLSEKDETNTNQVGNQNIVLYRYADLLLMLAEISNELQNGEQWGYVTEVLARVGLTPGAAYSGGQEAFREAIMAEYQFELLGEGHDWFNNRRRGFQWFKTHIIGFHHNHPIFDSNVDITLSENENEVMQLPIPDRETNANQDLD